MRTHLGLIVMVAALGHPLSEAAAKPEYSYKALDIIMSGAKCSARVGQLGALAKQAVAANEPGQAADMYANMASCYVELDDQSAALRFLNKAVSLGYADCFFLRTDANLKKLPGAAAVVARAKMSPADFEEMVWVYKEVMAIGHDTRMMITQNINRKDRDWTQIYTVKIPARRTSNVSLMLARWAIVYMQSWQRNMVMRSDQSRIMHLTNRTIINNMGRGNNTYRQQQELMSSRRIALYNARSRQRAVDARAFRPSGKSSRSISCNRY